MLSVEISRKNTFIFDCIAKTHLQMLSKQFTNLYMMHIQNMIIITVIKACSDSIRMEKAGSIG